MLELKNIALTVDGEKEKLDILKNVTFTLDENKIYVITGPNGGGKSSIAKIIMGIYLPTAGEIFFEGQDITHLDITQRAKMGIGYAFQNPPRFKGITVRELLNLASGGKTDLNVCDLLMDVGLCAQDYLEREVNASLSGGELKRIEIATILARNLKLAVFDEPEAGIDLWSFQRLAETFGKIHEKYQTTIVIISHQERILKLADEVILIANGEVSEITTKEKVLADIVRRDADCLCSQTCEKGVAIDAQCSR
ncbi:ABC transporter ATP-binding protein [Dehalobacterium formicoaceticum]|uniref:ATP-binding cassette domain-containing protein n=1 Tax=Dehalobacterium formicoaceticum TaxID=51515 RepID=A0ABT1Y4I4_9FIRM|nr:ATP-binding cassette domain-containing protein [Dehalobacterium formicoaceticum]MCR6545468.1 ATP-binding cassette domain-containing protein [Dehalobacterium formicoaceticum]